MQRPHVVRQPGRHRRRARPPLLRRARPVGRNRLGQWLAHTPMGQAEVVVAVVQGQLLVQALFALAQGGDASADRRHMLPDIEVDPVTVDGGIAPSTSASKPCVPLLRHTAPQ